MSLGVQGIKFKVEAIVTVMYSLVFRRPTTRLAVATTNVESDLFKKPGNCLLFWAQLRESRS